MPIYDMTTGKQIEIDGGPETYTVMEYNKETGEIEYSVKEAPKHISKNSLEKILKWAEAEEKRKKKLAKVSWDTLELRCLRTRTYWNWNFIW